MTVLDQTHERKDEGGREKLTWTEETKNQGQLVPDFLSPSLARFNFLLVLPLVNFSC